MSGSVTLSSLTYIHVYSIQSPTVNQILTLQQKPLLKIFFWNIQEKSDNLCQFYLEKKHQKFGATISYFVMIDTFQLRQEKWFLVLMGKGIRIWSQGIVTGSGTISDLLLGIVQVVFTDPHYGEVLTTAL